MSDANNIINKAFSEVLHDSNNKLMNLLSLCESPIEKIFLMKLYSFFHRVNASTEGSDFKILNKYLANQEEHIVEVDLNAFVIMSNHFHAIWQPLFGFTTSDIQASFMKYTGQQLKRSLEKTTRNF